MWKRITVEGIMSTNPLVIVTEYESCSVVYDAGMLTWILLSRNTRAVQWCMMLACLHRSYSRLTAPAFRHTRKRKVPRDVRNSKGPQTWRVQEMQVQNGTDPGVRRSKRSLLASRTRCNVHVLWKPPKFGNKVKIGNNVQVGKKFENWCNVWSIEGVTVYGHVPECHVTFGRERLHNVWWDSHIDHKTSWGTISFKEWTCRATHSSTLRRRFRQILSRPRQLRNNLRKDDSPHSPIDSD